MILFALSNPSSIYHGLIDFQASCTLSINQSTFYSVVVIVRSSTIFVLSAYTLLSTVKLGQISNIKMR